MGHQHATVRIEPSWTVFLFATHFLVFVQQCLPDFFLSEA